MGCDIHLYKEKKISGQWVTADSGWDDEYDEGYEDLPWEKRFTDRDYDLFGFLSKGVRRDHAFSFVGRGMPFNACPEVLALKEHVDLDGHSGSFLYLSELKDAWQYLQSKTVTVSGMKDADSFNELMESVNSDQPTDWSLLYPYCQGTTNHSYKSFEIEIPASYVLDGVKKIISLFEGIEAEDHRIVFWFDN
jgi:hypothetical protein